MLALNDGKQGLDEAVNSVLQALRELECDNDITTNSMEDNVSYVITQVLKEVYGSNNIDQHTGLGVLEFVKLDWFQGTRK